MDNATAALAKMNMILHDNPTAEIWQDNSLSSPHFKDKNGDLKTFDFVVANPPFSNKAWSNGFDPANDLYQRFEDGVPPQKNGDYAFLLHIIHSLKSTGKGAVILPHGVLFRGNAEAEIRTKIIRKGYIKGIISLPSNLFYGTGIPACIIVIDKENAASRTGIFMIDASKGFVKDGNKNRLRHQDLYKIVDIFNKQIELPKYSRMVSVDEIAANDYNLNIPRYIDSTEAEDLHDIEAHLLGGIPNRDIDGLDIYWQVFPTLKQQLFEAGPRPGYSLLRVDIAQIKPTILTHPEFVACTQTVTALFEQWQTTNMPSLKSLGVDSHPKQLIEALSEDVLQVFAKARLIDKYDIYQHLMSYWANTMQDDVYMIALDGWKANSDLIPPQFIINRYFTADQQAIEKLEANSETIIVKMEEMDEEHGGEGGLLEEAKNEKGKITKASVKARLRDIFTEPDTEDEHTMLNMYLDLLEQETEAKKKVGTILFAWAGTRGVSFGPTIWGGPRAVLNQHIYRIHPHKGINHLWLYKALEMATKNIERNAHGFKATLLHVRKEEITSQVIHFPPLCEQRAIATALSDMDALITSLDRLIAKKRDIKQATMQQLLTGKMRLPGFCKELKLTYQQTKVGRIPQEWEVKKLRDLCISITDGTHYTPRYVSDGIPFYSVENITANNFTDTKFISLKEHNMLIRRCKPEKGDILLTRIGSLGYTKLVNWDVNASIYVSLALLKMNNQQILADYMYEYSKSDQFVKDVEKRSLMNATPIKINMGQIGNIPIPCPPLPEQQAIATILSDMDAEIAALEQKRDKTRALKQGMMQELLTGKTRLI